MFLFSFWEDFGVIVLILVFFSLYKFLSDQYIPSPTIALMVTLVIVFVVVIPYEWFKYLLFVILFLYGFFQQ